MSHHGHQHQQHVGQRQQQHHENNSSNTTGSTVAQPNKKKALQALDALLATTISSSALPQATQDTFHQGDFLSHNYFGSDSHEQDYLAGPPSPSTGKAISEFLQENVEDDQLFEILELQKQHQRQQQLNRRLLQQQQKLYKEQQQRLMEEQKLHQEHLQRQYKRTQDQQQQQRQQQQQEDDTKSDALESVTLKKEFSPEHQLRLQPLPESNASHGDSTDSEPSRTPGAPSPSKLHRRHSTTTQDETTATTTNNVRRSSRTPKRRYKKTILRQQAVHLAAQIKIENESRDREATRRVIARAGVIKHLRSLRSWLMYAHYKVHRGWEEQPLHMVAEMLEEDQEECSGDSDGLDDPRQLRKRNIPRSVLSDRAARLRLPQDWDDADDENDIDDGISTPEPVIHDLASTESDSDSDSGNLQSTPCKPRTQYQHITDMNSRKMPPGTLLFKPQKLRKPAPLFSRMPASTLKKVAEPDRTSHASSDAEEELVPWTNTKPTEVKPALELLPISLRSIPKTQQELQIQQRLQLEELQKRQLKQLQDLQRMQQEQQMALQKAHSKLALSAGPTQRATDKNRDAEQNSPPKKPLSSHGKENQAPATNIGGTPPLKQVQRALALQQLQLQQRQKPTYLQSPSVSKSSSPPPHRTPSKPPKPILQRSVSRDNENLHRCTLSTNPKHQSNQPKQTLQREKPQVAERYTSGDESENRQASNARAQQKNISVDKEQQRLKLQKQHQQLRENDLKEKLLKHQEELQYRQLEKRRKQLLQLQAQHDKELSRHQRDQQEQRKPKLAKEKKSAEVSTDAAPSLSRLPVAPTPTRPTADDSFIMPAPSFVTPKKKKPLNPVQKAPSTENILASVRTSKISVTLPPLSNAKSALLGSKRVLALAEDKENFLAPGESAVQSNDTHLHTPALQKASFPFNGFKRQRQKSASPAQPSTPPTSDFPESSHVDLPVVTQTMADHLQETTLLSPPEILSASTTNPAAPQADSAAFTAALLEAVSPHVSTQVPPEESGDLHKNKEFMQYFDQWMSDIGNDDASDFVLSESQDAVGFDFSAPEASTLGSEELSQLTQAAIATPLMSEEAFSYLSGPENDGTDIEGSELDRLLYTEVGDTYGLYGTPRSDFGAHSLDLLTSDPVASELYDWFPDVNGDTSSLAGTPYAENPHLSMLASDPIMSSSPGELSQGLELDLEYDLTSDPVWLQQDLDLQQPQDVSSSRPGTPSLDSAASTVLSSTLSDMLAPAMDSPRAKHYQPMGLGGQPMVAAVMANSPLSLGLYQQGEADSQEESEEGAEGQQKQDFYEMPDPSLYASFVN